MSLRGAWSARFAARPRGTGWPGARRGAALLFLALLSGVLLCTDARYPLMKFDEGTYAEVARTMVRTRDWVVPRVRGRPYLDKPPLTYWVMAADFSVFGVHDWCARLAPQGFTLVCVLALFVVGRRTLGDRAAFLAALVLAVSPGCVTLGRKILCDQALTACVSAAWLMAAAAGGAERRARAWWYASALACGLGILAKGPIALVLVLPPLAVWHALGGAASRPALRDWLGYVATACAMALPWYVAVAAREPAFVRTFFWRHNVQRFLEPFDHREPFWFYLRFLPIGLGLWTPLVIPALCALARRPSASAGSGSVCLDTPPVPPLPRGGPRGADFKRTHYAGADGAPAVAGLALLIAVWCSGFFSASGCKLPAYILPAAPAAALVLGEFLDKVLFGGADHAVWRRLLRSRVLALLALAAGLAGIAVVLTIPTLRPWNVATGLCVAATGLVGLAYSARSPARGLVKAGIALAALALATELAHRALPPDRFSAAASEEIAFLRELSGDGADPVFLCESSAANVAFYLDSDNVRWLGDPPNTAAMLRRTGTRAIVVSQASGELPRIVARTPSSITVRRVDRPSMQVLLLERAASVAAQPATRREGRTGSGSVCLDTPPVPALPRGGQGGSFSN